MALSVKKGTGQDDGQPMGAAVRCSWLARGWCCTRLWKSGVTVITPQMSHTQLQDLMLALLGLGLALFNSFMSPYSFSFRVGMFTLCRWTLELCNLFSDFTGIQS